MNDKAIEQEIQAKGLTAPRITPADMQANIVAEHYFSAAEGLGGACDGYKLLNPVNGGLHLLTFCILVLRNGFTVTGESACASPENFDAEIGRKIARQNAEQKIWPMMGYELKQRLHDGSYVPPLATDGLPPHMQRVAAEKHQLDDKIGKLSAFFDTDIFKGLLAKQNELLTTQAGAMREYSGLLAERLALN